MGGEREDKGEVKGRGERGNEATGGRGSAQLRKRKISEKLETVRLDEGG